MEKVDMAHSILLLPGVNLFFHNLREKADTVP